MARKKDAANPRAVEGNNSKITLPAGKGEATLWVFDRLKVLAGHKTMISEKVKGIKEDAKTKYALPTAQLQVGARLARMTPEKRVVWTKNMEAAAGLFGYKFEDSEKYGAEANKELWGYVQQLVALDSEKKAITVEEREIAATAIASEIDIHSMREITRYAKDDPAEVEDKVAKLDVMFTFLQNHSRI